MRSSFLKLNFTASNTLPYVKSVYEFHGFQYRFINKKNIYLYNL